MTSQKTIFSAIQPSGNLHIGNYLGAIKQWVKLQNLGEYNNIFCIVDEHAITVPQNPEILRKKIMEVTLIYLASGIDPEKSLVFIQSHIPEHAELAWILNTITPLGELQRMTQFKDKTKEKGLLAGLLNYPVLMAGDILLYDTEVVPVGEDQVQHVEFARMIAKKFNNQYGETFKIPEASITKEGKRIMGLDDPRKKMSKSATSPKNYIAILDEPSVIRKKISSAVTDSGSEVKFDEKNKPAISNLLNIYSLFSGNSIKDLEKEYKGKEYSVFKKDLAEVIIKELSPIQKKYKELENNPSYVNKILKDGEKRAKEIASKKLNQVKHNIGFI
ncbi:MAG: tryptophan--tRNA ligase [Parcubacteria group bacterium CG10_big_fil_rev_8_21_14_0_10_38_31]|nr:MAG: tryptophan--tRNA ligase [Parcubacteria group bacterium CG10_big_fil_rev_8_21_14_0_10_38_31]